ncbi:ABC transporter substrate-binding protein [Chitinimonas sp. BJYL2]|uniref:substrate-binding periplasmic protein n=1 Tax=Chitinimonas sp. BJYL2 TaxID=2976696 RepID=UPI0022B4004A|nr:transporter substrate-binding domain-containing protein [Chitinimonas sp. BJYL2]
MDIGMRTFLVALLCCLLVVPSPAAASTGHACVKTVRWNPDLPYAGQDASGKLIGSDIELLQALLQRMDCRAQFVQMPWARALVELEHGKLDILPGAFKTAERERYARFSQAYSRIPNVLFVATKKLPSYRFSRLADLIGTDFRLGVQIHVSYGPEFEALKHQPGFRERLTPVTQRHSAWKMLALDRIDGLIADEVTALLELKALGLEQEIRKTSLIVSSDAAHIALSRKTTDEAFLIRFDAALDAIIADGTYLSIMQRHLPCKVSVRQLGCD